MPDLDPGFRRDDDFLRIHQYLTLLQDAIVVAENALIADLKCIQGQN